MQGTNTLAYFVLREGTKKKVLKHRRQEGFGTTGCEEGRRRRICDVRQFQLIRQRDKREEKDRKADRVRASCLER